MTPTAWLHKEIERLGARAEYNADLNMYRIRRGEDHATSREVQVWGHELKIAKGHTTARVEGREETVLLTEYLQRFLWSGRNVSFACLDHLRPSFSSVYTAF